MRRTDGVRSVTVGRLAVLVLAGWLAVSGGAAPGWAADPIPIGYITPLTGSPALEGTFMSQGVELAVGELNAKGGVLGRPIKVIIEDGRADPQESTSAAEKLIVRDRVVALVGAWASSATLAVMNTVARHRVPFVVEISTNPKITESGNPWVFRIASTEAVNSAFVVPKLLERGFGAVHFVAVNNDWGRGAVESHQQGFQTAGARVTGAEFYNVNEVDFKPILLKARSSGASAIMFTGDIRATANFRKQMRELNLQLPVYLSGGQTLPTLGKVAGLDLLEGVYLLGYTIPNALEGDPRSPALQAFVRKFKERFPQYEAERGTAHAYDAVMLVADAIARAKSLEAEALRKALAASQYTGLSGDIKFDPKGQSRPALFLTQVRDGKQMVIGR
jgi:branched-chain amino acid transport system substrate-binding protein